MDKSEKPVGSEVAEESCDSDNHESFNWIDRPLLFVIVVFFCLVLAYFTNFNSHEISDDPGDWGVLGDYVGGIANPLISMMALIYLAKAYYTQKSELKDTRIALKDTAKYSESSARSQERLVGLAIKQEAITSINLELKFLAMQINLHQSKISYLHNELSNSVYNFNKFSSTIDVFSVESNNWISDRSKMDNYRFKIIRMMKDEEVEISKLISKTKELFAAKAAIGE